MKTTSYFKLDNTNNKKGVRCFLHKMKSISTLKFLMQTIFMTKSIHFLSYDIASNLSIDSTISFSLIVIFRALQFTEDNHIMNWTLKMLNLTWIESSREHFWSSRRLFTFRIFIFFLKTTEWNSRYAPFTKGNEIWKSKIYRCT